MAILFLKTNEHLVEFKVEATDGRHVYIIHVNGLTDIKCFPKSYLVSDKWWVKK